MRILIADDDLVTTELVRELLRARGFEISVAQDGMQAVMMAMRQPPDAIVLDIGMPGGSGLHVLERLKASTKTNTIPVVVLTALSDPAVPSQARALGAREFLRKPVVVEQLYGALDRVLGSPPKPSSPAQ